MSLRLRGHHPLRPGIQPGSPRTWFCDSRPARRRRDRASHDTTGATPDGYHAPMVWPGPLSLATTHGISFPAGTEMFHFPAYPPHKAVPAHDGRRVSPFGNPRIKARLAAPRGLSQPPTSFIGPVCQGIYHTPLQATHTPVRDPQAPNQQIPRRQIITSEMITKRSTNNTKNEVRSKNTAIKGRDKPALLARVHYPVLKPPRTRPATTRTPPGDAPQDRDDGRHTGDKPHGWRSGNPKACPHHSKPHDLFHTSTPRTNPRDHRGNRGRKGHQTVARKISP